METTKPGQIVSFYGQVASAESTPVNYVLPEHDEWRNFAGQAEVRAMAVNPQTGEVWVASSGGVRAIDIRGEQRTYRRFASEHGLPGNSISSVCVDEQGHVWVASDEGGLAIHKGGRWAAYENDLRYGSLLTNKVRVLAECAHQSGIWAATNDAIFRLPGPNQYAVPLTVDGDNTLLWNVAALLDTPDRLLIGTRSGLSAVSQDGKVRRISTKLVGSCNALAVGPDGTIWLGAADTLLTLNEDIATPRCTLSQSAGPNVIRSLAATQTRVWILTNLGIYIWENGAVVAVPSPHGRPFAMAAVCRHSLSRDDYVWVGGSRPAADGFAGVFVDLQATAPESMNQVPEDKVRWDFDLITPHADDQLLTAGIREIAGPDRQGAIWFGGESGLLCYREGSWLQSAADAIRWLSDDIRMLKLDSYGDLWLLAYPQGVLRIDPLSKTINAYSPPPGLVTSIEFGHDGQPYCTTGRGLWRLDHEGWKLVVRDMPGQPTALSEVRRADTGTLQWWLATSSGLYNSEAGKWRSAHASDTDGTNVGTLRNISINSLLVTSSSEGDVLWVGAVNGLWRHSAESWEFHDPGGQVTSGTDSLGTSRHADHEVTSLAHSVGDSLWMACAGGVLRYTPLTRQVDSTTVWTPMNSGLGAEVVRALLQVENELWIALPAGISRVRLT